jgi:hypothetical protein
MIRIIHKRTGMAFFILAACLSMTSQENAGKGLPALVKGNERFGRRLLEKRHAVTPDRNVVISPIGLTLIFAALRAHTYSGGLVEQVDKVFGWERHLGLSLPARQLLAVFEKPEKPKPCPKETPESAASCRERVQDGAWISNTFLYRTPPGLPSPIDEYFLRNAKRNFKFTFIDTGAKKPQSERNRRLRKSTGDVPDTSAPDDPAKDADVLIVSGIHLQTAWSGNTFAINRPHNGSFMTETGQTRTTEVLDSELEQYLYAKNEKLEAAALPCNLGYMIVVLPPAGTDIHTLELQLAEEPDLLDAALKRQLGTVTMPTFQIRLESDFMEPIKAMGITQPFEDLGSIFTIPKSHITQVRQRIDLSVTKEGIRADAETVVGAVYGGILAARPAFHMVLDRPFLFLIRDQTTNALLFMGAVMDPSARN